MQTPNALKLQPDHRTQNNMESTRYSGVTPTGTDSETLTGYS